MQHESFYIKYTDSTSTPRTMSKVTRKGFSRLTQKYLCIMRQFACYRPVTNAIAALDRHARCVRGYDETQQLSFPSQTEQDLLNTNTMYLVIKALHVHTIISYQKRHARGYFIMQVRRERALGDRRWRMYLSPQKNNGISTTRSCSQNAKDYEGISSTSTKISFVREIYYFLELYSHCRI